MGCVGSNENEREIEEKYKMDVNKEKQIHKLLMLGSGASGKSTLFKQLGWLYGVKEADKNYTDTDAEDRLAKIRENMSQNIVVLLKKSQELYDRDNIKYIECKVDFNNKNDDRVKTIIKDIQYVAQFQNVQFIETQKTEQELALLGESIHRLWMLNEIKTTFKHRQVFSFSDNMDYFFDKSIEIFKANYRCTKQDFLRTRVRTTGVTKIELEVPNIDENGNPSTKELNKFQIIDVGGQRNERNKWIHQFSTVTAVIFVAALNHYCQVLFEDETKNAMQESIELFAQIANLRHFQHTEMILFLNKDDLFMKKLAEGLKLSLCFDSTINKDYNGEQWNGNDESINFNPNKQFRDNDKRINYLDECRKAALQFIRARYKEVVPTGKGVYMHETTATDPKLVEKVFWDVQNIVIRANLAKGGIMG